MKKLGIVLILAAALMVRVYRLEESSHFLSDESRDLVNMHQIWVEKKLTLAGPISDDGSHMFSSLTYYLLLPFAVVYDFDPLGPVAGAVFWGMVTFGVMWFLTTKCNPRYIWISGIILAIWYPLVETSRWAWNPNLLPVWISLGILGNGLGSGLALGLALHQHVLALIPAMWVIIKKRSWWVILGFLMAVSPFVMFDLRHPPGLFWRQVVTYGKPEERLTTNLVINKIKLGFTGFEKVIFSQSDEGLLRLLGWAVLGLVIWDVKNNKSNLYWGGGWMLPILATVKFSPQWHYYLPALPFFIVWLVCPRKKPGRILTSFLILIIGVTSLLNISKLWYQKDWTGNIKLVREVTNIMEREISQQKLINANMAVLGSPDIYTNGNKYRDLLLVRNVRLKNSNEYERSDNLFVVTTGLPERLRKDPATELMYFKSGPIAGVWETGINNWKVVQMNRY